MTNNGGFVINLVDALKDILENLDGAIGEYDLMTLLAEKGAFDHLIESEVVGMSSLTLFKKHFITMNLLYELQKHYVTNKRYLSISALDIRLEPLNTSAGNSADIALADDTPLRDYYLDWANYDAATNSSVIEMLTSFWATYDSHQKQPEAYEVLELEEGVEWRVVQVQYRRLVKKYHPDAGGDAEKFRGVREAYECLKRTYGHL